MTTPTKFDDTIDSREVIARIAELTAEREDFETHRADCETEAEELEEVGPEDLSLADIDRLSLLRD